MFKRLLIFTTVYFSGMAFLWLTYSLTNAFHFSMLTYVTAFFLGLWEERWENKIEK